MNKQLHLKKQSKVPDEYGDCSNKSACGIIFQKAVAKTGKEGTDADCNCR